MPILFFFTPLFRSPLLFFVVVFCTTKDGARCGLAAVVSQMDGSNVCIFISFHLTDKRWWLVQTERQFNARASLRLTFLFFFLYTDKNERLSIVFFFFF